MLMDIFLDQVYISHGNYFNINQVRANNDFYLDDASVFDIDQVYLEHGYYCEGYHHRSGSSMGPGHKFFGVGLGSSQVSRREECHGNYFINHNQRGSMPAHEAQTDCKAQPEEA